MIAASLICGPFLRRRVPHAKQSTSCLPVRINEHMLCTISLNSRYLEMLHARRETSSSKSGRRGADRHINGM
eukprot:5323011-Pyramimonas_sp.AAC.1